MMSWIATALCLSYFCGVQGYGRHDLLPEVLQSELGFGVLIDDVKIVGGSEVIPGQLPYQVSLQRRRRFSRGAHFCGGSIITKVFVLTAAHCVHRQLPSGLQIVAGEHEFYKSEGTEQLRRVIRIIPHKFYNPATLKNDIALLQLSSPLKFGKYVDKIDLPEKDSLFPSGSALVSGWGALASGDPNLPFTLRAVTVPIKSDAFCQLAYGEPSIHAPSMLCAGAQGIDSCQGDSGGPLVCKDPEEESVLCGVVSWGKGCALRDYPGVYTEVAFFLPWIRHHAKPDDDEDDDDDDDDDDDCTNDCDNNCNNDDDEDDDDNVDDENDDNVEDENDDNVEDEYDDNVEDESDDNVEDENDDNVEDENGDNDDDDNDDNVDDGNQDDADTGDVIVDETEPVVVVVETEPVIVDGELQPVIIDGELQPVIIWEEEVTVGLADEVHVSKQDSSHAEEVV